MFQSCIYPWQRAGRVHLKHRYCFVAALPAVSVHCGDFAVLRISLSPKFLLPPNTINPQSSTTKQPQPLNISKDVARLSQVCTYTFLSVRNFSRSVVTLQSPLLGGLQTEATSSSTALLSLTPPPEMRHHAC